MIYKEELEKIRKELIERKDDLQRELEGLPEGELYCTDNSGYRKYYRRVPAVGNRKKERRYSIKSKKEILNKMVRKKYVSEAIAIIEKDIQVMETAIKGYVPSDENSLMGSFSEKYPELISGIYRDTQNEENWGDAFRRIDDYYPENLKQTAIDGTKMRSKNEVFIASRLDHYNQIYRSDCETGIEGLRRAPDFTILRKKDRKIIYWEHMGMMDNDEYRADNKQKLAEYEAAGIVPWDNLIITYDTVGGGIRADMIEAMIQGWLL